MRTMRVTLPLLVAALLCACGQKGNLYLPDQQPAVVGSTIAEPAASPAPAAPAAGAAGATDAAATADPSTDERENAARNRN